MENGKFHHAGRQFTLRHSSQVLLDGGPQIGSETWRRQLFRAEANHWQTVRLHFQSHEVAAEPHFRSRSPLLACGRIKGESLQLFCEPAEMAVGEAPRLGNGATAGNRHARRAVGSESQQITSRPGMADQQQRDTLTVHLKPVAAGRVQEIKPGTHVA
jgi:hypothetical protein